MNKSNPLATSVSALAAIALAGSSLCVVPNLAAASDSNVSFVRILRVTQNPYNPVQFRVWEKAPPGDEIFVGVNLYIPGTAVRVGGTKPVTFSQPYYSTSLTVTWNKRGVDGSRIPKGKFLIARAFASDLTTSQQPLLASRVFYFYLTT